MWQLLLQWLRALWLRLCGLQYFRTVDRTERQQLLGPEAARSAAATPEAECCASPGPQLPCTLVVMRHGHRQDEEDTFWHQTAARPWDPPLSAKGRTQAAEAAGTLAGMTVDYVISSPFKRCLQTSAGVVRALPGLREGHWLVDWQLAEVCEPRVLFGMRADAKAQATDSDVESWMWGGMQTPAALDKFAREDCRLQKLPFKPVLRQKAKPVFPEDTEEGLSRYSAAFKEIARSFAGHTVLLVTHGECVRQAVLMAEPFSEVFEVKHTGFVTLKHATVTTSTPQQQQQRLGSPQRAPSHSHGPSSRGKWQLMSGSGETGVLWIEDDDDDD